jgi:hypothetical protein
MKMNHPESFELYAAGGPVGVFKGFSPLPHQLEVDVVVPHQGGGLPGFGEFLLIELSGATALVGRVSRYHAAGQLASERGDAYLVDLMKAEEPMPEAVARQVLRYNLKVHLLGHLQRDAVGFKFSVGERAFATLGGHVRLPSDAALRFLCNVGLEDDPTAVPLGHLVHGQREIRSVPVRFSVGRLKGRRSFVFARAGYGKSNLIKYLVSQLYASPPDVGLLIFDPEGEYALPDAHGRPGLVNVPALESRISLYTNRQVSTAYQAVFRGTAGLNLGDFLPQDIVSVFVPPDKQDTVFANLLRAMDREEWRKLVGLLARDGFHADDRKIAQFLGYKPKTNDVSIAAIRNNLIPPIRRLHNEGATLGKNVIVELRQARVVVVDTSLLGGEDAFAVTKLLMHRIFDHNVRHLVDVSGPTARCLVVLEEAQTFLGERVLDERNVFVRWVKEGRKYGLGAILVTQQPGAISSQIISQGDNFFVLHLLNEGDLQALKKHNAYYSDEILNFIRAEPIPGNCFFWSAPNQPFVVSARIANFESICAPRTPAVPAPAAAGESLERVIAAAVKEALEKAPRLWIYRVHAFDEREESGWIAFSRDYLIDVVAREVNGHAAIARLSDRAEWLRTEAPEKIEIVLKRHKLRAGFAVLEGVTRPVWSIPATDIHVSKQKGIRPVSVALTTGV